MAKNFLNQRIPRKRGHVKHARKHDGKATLRNTTNGVVFDADNPRSNPQGKKTAKVLHGVVHNQSKSFEEAIADGDIKFVDGKALHERSSHFISDTLPTSQSLVIRIPKKHKVLSWLWEIIKDKNLYFAVAGSTCQREFSDREVQKNGNRLVYRDDNGRICSKENSVNGKQSYGLIATEALVPVPNNQGENLLANIVNLSVNEDNKDNNGNPRKRFAYAKELYIKISPKQSSFVTEIVDGEIKKYSPELRRLWDIMYRAKDVSEIIILDAPKGSNSSNAHRTGEKFKHIKRDKVRDFSEKRTNIGGGRTIASHR